MAALTHFYAEGIGFSTSSPHGSWQTVATIPGTNLTSGTYLIFMTGFFSHASSANEAQARLTLGGTQIDDSFQAYELTNTVQEGSFSWIGTVAGGSGDLVLEVASSGTNQIVVQWAGILALKVDEISGSWDFDEKSEDYSTTTTLTDHSALLLNANGTDTYLVFGYGQQIPGSSSSNYKMSLVDSVTGTLAAIDIEGEDPAQEYRSHLLMAAYVPSSGSHTLSMQFAHESVAGSVLHSKVGYIKLNAFDQFIVSSDASEDTPATTPNWTTTRTISPTPNVTGDWFLWGYYLEDANNITDAIATRLQVNPDGSGLVSSPNYGDTSPAQNSWDPTDIIPVNIWTVESLTSGAARAVNLDVQATAGSDLRINTRTLVGFSLELAGSGATYVDLDTSVTGTTSTTAGSGVLRSLDTQTNGDSSVASSLKPLRSIESAVVGQAQATAGLSTLATLAGETAGTAQVTPTLSPLRSLESLIDGSATVETALSLLSSLSASLNTGGSVTATLDVQGGLAAEVAGTTELTGLIKLLSSLEAELLSTANTNGFLAPVRDIAAEASGTGTAEAAFKLLLGLAGSLSAKATTSGDLGLVNALAANIEGASSVAADVEISSAVLLSAQASGTTEIEAASSVLLSFASEIAGEAVITGTTYPVRGFAASVAGQGAVDSSAIILRGLSSLIDTGTTASGDLRPVRDFATQVAGSAGISSTLKTVRGLSVAVSGEADLTGFVEISTAIEFAANIAGASNLDAGLQLVTSLSAEISGSQTVAAGLQMHYALFAALAGQLALVAEFDFVSYMAEPLHFNVRDDSFAGSIVTDTLRLNVQHDSFAGSIVTDTLRLNVQHDNFTKQVK